MNDCRPCQIIVAEPFNPTAVHRLEEVGQVRILEDSAPQTLIDALPDAHALLVRSKAHVTARIINAAPRLKVIGRASANVDHIDLKAARQRGIRVVFAPHVAVASTAEFALALILTVTRRIPSYDRILREGKFDTARAASGHEMGQLTLGLLGIDPVADRLATMCNAAFGSEIIYHDPRGHTHTECKGRPVDLDTLLTQADILSVHLPLSPNTRGLLGAEHIAKLKSTAIVVNTSRGAVIDTVALAHALRKRQIAGAGLDVFETEPLPTTHPLRRAPNCILTPHVAGATLDAAAGRFSVTDDVVRVLKGEEPRFPMDD